MSMLRSIRLLTALEGSMTAADLDSTLSDSSRFGEFRTLLSDKGMAKRVYNNASVMTKIRASNNASNVLLYAGYVDDSIIGTYFPYLGGYYAGYINFNGKRSHYIAASVVASVAVNSNWTTIPWCAGTTTDMPNMTSLGSYPGYTTIDPRLTYSGDTTYDGQALTIANYNASPMVSTDAMGRCKSLSLTPVTGYTFADYFLPSVYELDMMYRNAYLFNKNSGTSEAWDMTKWYWSSTELSSTTAWAVNFANGTVGNTTKTGTNSVRAVRKFTI